MVTIRWRRETITTYFPQTGSDNTIVGNMAMDSGDDNIDLWVEDNTLIENNIIFMRIMGSHLVDGIEISDGSSNVSHHLSWKTILLCI